MSGCHQPFRDKLHGLPAHEPLGRAFWKLTSSLAEWLKLCPDAAGQKVSAVLLLTPWPVLASFWE